MQLDHHIIIPDTLGEPATYQGSLEVIGRSIHPEGFIVYFMTILENTRQRVYILTDEQGRQQEMIVRLDGIYGPENTYVYSTEILLRPGKYSIKPKD